MNRSGFSALLIVGALLILGGLIALAMPVFATHETKDVAHVGDLHLQATENHYYEIPPLVSGGALALGVILLGAGFYQRR